MSKNNKIFCIVVIILIIILLIYKNMINKPSDEQQGITEDGVIVEEDYYKEKIEEYEQISEEYENLVVEYREEKFTDEEKNVIKNYQEQMTAALQEGDKEKKIKISEEYVKVYQQYMEKEFTKEQLKKLKKLDEKIDDLESVVQEYSYLLDKQEEIESQKGLLTLENGVIVSQREGIISDKEYNGFTFSNIELSYNPKTRKTTLKMLITNTANTTRGDELVELKFSGRTQAFWATKIEKIGPNERMEMEIPIDFDLTDTDSFEILKFNSEDFK